jgi:hypothetical protein
LSSIDAVASVALAAVGDLGDSDNVGWAVDEATIEQIFIDPATRFLKAHTRIAFQGEATALMRLSYQAHVLAIAADEDVELESLVLVPNRISSSLTAVRGVSRGTVTLDRPAPGGAWW